MKWNMKRFITLITLLILILSGISEEDAKTLALASETVQKFMEGKKPKKVIVIKGRLVNIVI